MLPQIDHDQIQALVGRPGGGPVRRSGVVPPVTGRALLHAVAEWEKEQCGQRRQEKRGEADEQRHGRGGHLDPARHHQKAGHVPAGAGSTEHSEGGDSIGPGHHRTEEELPPAISSEVPPPLDPGPIPSANTGRNQRNMREAGAVWQPSTPRQTGNRTDRWPIMFRSFIRWGAGGAVQSFRAARLTVAHREEEPAAYAWSHRPGRTPVGLATPLTAQDHHGAE